MAHSTWVTTWVLILYLEFWNVPKLLETPNHLSQRRLVFVSHLRTFCNDLVLVKYSDEPIVTSLDDPRENASLAGFSHWLNPLSLEIWVESHT